MTQLQNCWKHKLVREEIGHPVLGNPHPKCTDRASRSNTRTDNIKADVIFISTPQSVDVQARVSSGGVRLRVRALRKQRRRSDRCGYCRHGSQLIQESQQIQGDKAVLGPELGCLNFGWAASFSYFLPTLGLAHRRCESTQPRSETCLVTL